MPDLNFYNEEVKQEFENITTFWLNDMNVDGFRLDAVRYLHENGAIVQDLPETKAYWKEFRDFYKSVNPNAFAVGEAWDATPIAQDYVNGDRLDYVFEFDLAGTMIQSVNNGVVGTLDNKVGEVMQAYPFLQFGSF